jgi:5-methylcytosine-specific restriction endonuclease McrA
MTATLAKPGGGVADRRFGATAAVMPTPPSVPKDRADFDPRKTNRWTQLAKRLAADAHACAICGGAFPAGVPPRSRWSRSVDHLVPIAYGGSPFALENLRTVHYGCNSRRGARQPKLRRPRRRPRVVRAVPEAWL